MRRLILMILMTLLAFLSTSCCSKTQVIKRCPKLQYKEFSFRTTKHYKKMGKYTLVPTKDLKLGANKLQECSDTVKLLVTEIKNYNKDYTKAK